MKKIVSILMAVCLAGTMLSGCGSGGKDGTEAAGTSGVSAESTGGVPAAGAGTSVTVGITTDPADLSPFAGASNGRNTMLRQCYEYLLDYSLDGQEKVLAREINQVDPCNYEIVLYDYIYDTAGNHLTAEDVKFSFETAKSIGKTPAITYLAGVEVKDEYTVIMTLTGDMAGQFEKLCGGTPVVTKAAFEASPDGMVTTPVGTTPYILADFISGSSYTFAKADSYWQKDDLVGQCSKANVDKIVFNVITETSQMAIALETGTIDLAANIDSSEIARFSDKEKYTVNEYYDSLLQVMMFNCDDGNVFANEDLRKACLYALDVDAMMDAVCNGFALKTNAFAIPFRSDYNKEWDNEDYFGFNLDTAKEYLSKSGHKEGELTIRIMTDNSSTKNKLAQIMQGYLLQIGVNSEILNYDDALYNSYKYDSTQWDIILDNKGSDVNIALLTLCEDARSFENGTANFVHDDKLQAMIEKTSTVAGWNQENMDEVEAYLKEKAYVRGLFHVGKYSVGTSKVKEIAVNTKTNLIPNSCVFEWN